MSNPFDPNDPFYYPQPVGWPPPPGGPYGIQPNVQTPAPGQFKNRPEAWGLPRCGDGVLGRENTRHRSNGAREVIVVGSYQPGTGVRLFSGLNDNAGGEPTPSPEIMTLCLYRSNQDQNRSVPLPTGADQRIYAHIVWGSGKAANEALVDFHHGARISLDAQTVTLDAVVDYELANVANTYTVEVSAGLVYGAVSGHQLTYTDARTLIESGATSSFRPVPKFSRSVIVYPSNPAITSATIRFSSDSKGTGGTELAINVPVGIAVQIPNGIEGYALSNDMTDAPGSNFVALFPLYL